MSVEIEREFSFLVNELPAGLEKFPSKIIEDNYIPTGSYNPSVRVRRNGEKYEITKKQPVDSTSGDSTRQIEHTILLTRAEYDFLNKLDGKRFRKRRFMYEIDGYTAELDVYLDKLAGLAVVEFEFSSEEEMANFVKPEFARADVSQELYAAGGFLAGKSYDDIADVLKEKYGYEPIKEVEKYAEH
ncbi:adenylate cyclase [Candidatus Saccharibacteria bacterium]|nr:adenylate cyclase [Candidatus Saccharibacteria bacterium]MCL1963366.1 adenylate cyclase [Candidatus Saccharibacteria bacterium]